MKGMLSIPKEFFKMSEKVPKLSIALGVADGWFDPDTYGAIASACFSFFSHATLFASIEVVDVRFEAQFNYNTYTGIVGVRVEVKGISVRDSHEGSELTALISLPDELVVADPKQARKYPNLATRTKSMEGLINRLGAEFSHRLRSHLESRGNSLRHKSGVIEKILADLKTLSFN